jgi:hypothetical protein
MMPPSSLSEENRGSGTDSCGLLIDRTLKRKMDESDMNSRGTEKRLKHAGSTVMPVQDNSSEEDAVSSNKDDKYEPNNDEQGEDEQEGNKPDEKLLPVIGSHPALSKTIDTKLPPMHRLDNILPIWLLEH